MSLIFAAYALLSSAGPAQGAVPQDSIASIAIRTLTRDAARDSTAVLRFWQDLERSGAPLVEANPGDSTVRLVTFVWKETEPLDNVAVITPHSLIDVDLGRMRRVTGTDVWYRTYLMRSDARMVYRFGPNDNMVPFTRDRNLIERMNGWQLDPLNSQVWTFGDGTRVSVLPIAGPSLTGWWIPSKDAGLSTLIRYRDPQRGRNNRLLSTCRGTMSAVPAIGRSRF